MARRRVLGWFEQDAYTRWRHVYAWRPGELARIKRRTHKRERREGRRDAADQLVDDAIANAALDGHHINDGWRGVLRAVATGEVTADDAVTAAVAAHKRSEPDG